MSDWIGIAFIVSVFAAGFLGLKILSVPRKRTEAEFERNAGGNTSLLGVGMNALHGLLGSQVEQIKEAKRTVKYQKQKQGEKDDDDQLVADE